MRIAIKQTNLTLTPEHREFIESKLESLDKYFPKIGQIRVEIERNAHHNKGDVFRAEANISIPNKILRIEKTTPDFRKSVEKVKDHAKLLLSKEKKKVLDKVRRR